jgi:hypothetical protein
MKKNSVKGLMHEHSLPLKLSSQTAPQGSSAAAGMWCVAMPWHDDGDFPYFSSQPEH